jgi:hypothetical protein
VAPTTTTTTLPVSPGIPEVVPVPMLSRYSLVLLGLLLLGIGLVGFRRFG